MDIHHRLDSGAFSTVYAATYSANRSQKALKCLDPSSIPTEFLAPDHPHILTPTAVRSDADGALIVYDRMDFSLLTLLNTFPVPLPLGVIKRLSCHLFRALDAVHSEGIVHRDVKPGNLVIDATFGTLLLADFGQARLVAPHMTPTVSTRWYRAPELLYGSPNYSQQVDLWSAGVTVAHMLLREPPFPGRSDLDQLARVAAFLGPEHNEWACEYPDHGLVSLHLPNPPTRPLGWDELDPGAVSLVERLLLPRPDQRLNSSAVLADDWLKDAWSEVEVALFFKKHGW